MGLHTQTPRWFWCADPHFTVIHCSLSHQKLKPVRILKTQESSSWQEAQIMIQLKSSTFQPGNKNRIQQLAQLRPAHQRTQPVEIHKTQSTFLRLRHPKHSLFLLHISRAKLRAQPCPVLDSQTARKMSPVNNKINIQLKPIGRNFMKGSKNLESINQNQKPRCSSQGESTHHCLEKPYQQRHDGGCRSRVLEGRCWPQDRWKRPQKSQALKHRCKTQRQNSHHRPSA